MSTLSDIPIQVEQSPPPPRDFGNALPILGEIRHAVARLAETGEATRIDLAAIPFGPGDEDRLLELLGRGEVQATVDALGPTRIWETRFPGVWLVDYANADDQRLALQIEVDEVPQILRTQHADLSDSLSALDASLEAASRAASPAPESSPESPPESGTDSGTPAL
jgi:hydrogenase-1 operon protein HyaF